MQNPSSEKPWLRRSLLFAGIGLSALPVVASITRRDKEPPPAPIAHDVIGNASVLRPEMFGSMQSVAETTATLRAALDTAISTRKPIELTGRYRVNGPITANAGYPRASLNLRLNGDVEIEVAPDTEPVEYFIVAVSEAPDSHSITGGSLTIRCNRRVQRALSLVSNSGGATGGGRVIIEAPVRVHDVHAPLGSKGVAYGIAVSGPFMEVSVHRPEVEGVSRHPLLSMSGDCKGIRIDQARGPVVITNPRIRNVQNSVQDADGIFILAPLINGTPAGPSARIIDGVFEDCQGRSIKTQVSHTEVINPVFRRRDLVSIRESCDIDTQFGSLSVVGWRAEYRKKNGTSPLGRNHRPFFIQSLYRDAPRQSVIGTGDLVTEASMPNLVYVNVGPTSPDQSVLIEHVRITPAAGLGQVFRDGLLSYRAEGVDAASSRLDIDIRDVSGPAGLVLCGCDTAAAAAQRRTRLRIDAPTVLSS